MATDDAARASWVTRVLGVNLGGAQGGRTAAPPDLRAFRAAWSDAAASWQDASETVDAQISQLQNALRATPDPDYHQIADAGLNGITGNHKVPVLAAIREINAADGQTLGRAAAKASAAVQAFITHLSTDPRVGACDQNPLGVSVSIGATLLPALQKLATTLQNAA